jgi:signal transduction histidine kinase/ActR/RegA family two-component response regulator
VLVALTAFALWVDFTTRAATTDLRTIILASDAVESARDLAGDEKVLATSYRLVPSPETLSEHTAAAAAFNRALTSGSGDREIDSNSVETQILSAHARYMDSAGQMFAALATGDTAAAETIRTEQVDPVYDWFDGQMDTLAAERRALAHDRLNAFDARQNWVATASVVVFALGLSLLGVFWSVLRSLGRRAERNHAELIRVNAETAAERELARSKDELVAMVSHELASPVTNLVAYAELLATQDHPAPERQEMLTTMVLEGRRLTALIHEFLDVRRLETGRFDLTPRPTDLLALLNHAATIAKRDVDHPLKVDLPATLPLVNADAGRVQQILANLLSNARKYTPTGCEIRLGARELDGAVEVYVADKGLGIPAEALPRLFEKFYRVPGEDRRGTQGTGLGLAVTRDLIEAQGGQIGIESAGRGQGSRFWFTLPLAEVGSRIESELHVTKPSSTSAIQQVPTPPSRPLRLLAVDDDAAIGSMIRRVMRASGYETVTTTTAEEALELLRAQPFDIVLSDLGLGLGMDGWDLAARVRSDWHLPFVLATGSVGISVDEVHRRGVDGLISKPYLPAELLALLERLAPSDMQQRAA